MSKRIVLLTIAFTIMAVVSAQPLHALAGESMATRFGVVETSKSDENSTASDTIIVDGKAAYKEEGMFISLMEKFSIGERDLALFGTNCGGTACVNDYLHFLVLQAKKPPKVTADPGFISFDGTVKTRVSNGRIVVDLGNEGGRRKTAVFDGNTVTVQLTAQKKTQLNEKECQWAFEYGVDGQCIAHRLEDPACTSLRIDFFPGAVRRGIATLSNNPGFNYDAFEKQCNAACKSGKAPKYQVFKKAVCGW